MENNLIQFQLFFILLSEFELSNFDDPDFRYLFSVPQCDRGKRLVIKFLVGGLRTLRANELKGNLDLCLFIKLITGYANCCMSTKLNHYYYRRDFSYYGK